MIKLILITALIVLPFLAFGQSNKSFPYKDGEQQLLKDFFEFYAYNKKSAINDCEYQKEDSAGIYIIEIFYSDTAAATKFAVYGSTGKDDLTNLIRNFFYSSIHKWNKKFLKKMRVIIPVIILNTCPMQPGKIFIDWLQFGWNHKILSGNCFFVSPVYQQFFYTSPDLEVTNN
jgi:hypothetical protein